MLEDLDSTLELKITGSTVSGILRDDVLACKWNIYPGHHSTFQWTIIWHLIAS